MKIILLILFGFELFYGKSQTLNSCDSIKKLGSGTFQAIVRYQAITEDDNDHFMDKKYKNIKKKYNATNLIICSSIDCNDRPECGCIFLLSYKRKYKYTLYHLKNKNGIYEDWAAGKLIKITFIKNNLFENLQSHISTNNTNSLLGIVTDIEPYYTN